jgi:hypothetical protein
MHVERIELERRRLVARHHRSPLRYRFTTTNSCSRSARDPDRHAVRFVER